MPLVLCNKHKEERLDLSKLNKAILLLSILIISICSVAPVGNAVKKDRVTGKDIIAFAEKHLGKPYRHGATGPNSFDCSGFVFFVFNHFGVELSTSSHAYYNSPEEYGKLIDEKDAKPGDIVSWSGHVGIYIGKGRVIHALNYRSGVCETEVEIFRNSRGVSNPPHHFIRVDVNPAPIQKNISSTPLKDAVRSARSDKLTVTKESIAAEAESRLFRKAAVIATMKDIAS